MLNLRLTPQKREFFVLYNQAAANTVTIAGHLGTLLDTFPDGTRDAIDRIAAAEHDGDRITREIVDQLNRTFVTPFDRDDMYRLAAALDDICDHVDEAADNIGVYGVKVIPPEAKTQARIILDSARTLVSAVDRLQGFKDASAELARLHELEDEGDHVERDAIAGLFRSGQDPISIIRWKDLHEQLERAVDACERAAKVLEAILVKNR